MQDLNVLDGGHMFYNQEIKNVVEALDSDLTKGLSNELVEASRLKHGENALQEKKQDSIIKKFFLQMKDPLVIVLLAAAIISYIVDPHEIVESIIIVFVVVFNAVLGVYQENSAEKSLEALKNLSSPNAKVIRNGDRINIPSKDVVVGDVVLIEAGDFVASDGRIFESYNMQIDESSLTGESVPVNKMSGVIDSEKLPLGDQKNMVFASTVCTYGRGKILVTTVGMKNEVGKIATLLQEGKNEATPLQIKLNQISKIIGLMCLAICAVVFALEMMAHMSVLDAFKTSVALAVAAIPEGLATVVTIVLALGVNKMVKKNSIVRKLQAVETLGSCSIICSDKTGTLTQNKMTVTHTYLAGQDTQPINFNNHHEQTLMRYFTLCSDGEVKVVDGKVELLGDPTETALVYALYQFNELKSDLEKKYQRVDELAFDSDRKLMTVFYKTEDGYLQVTKGAPDILMGKSVNVTDADYKANDAMAAEALRVLAVGIKTYEALPDISTELEEQLEFVGLVGMIDPPRLEVKKAIADAKLGGIKTVMITGDHLITAKAIAKQLGILNEGDLAIDGKTLEAMSDEELAVQVKLIRVYARVAPEHKVRIVKAWQALGQVVAMTGDGVNDSPALKTADIGCAMGITGTDVSKNAADMILTDDNFATIIEAVKEGRGIYSNIKKDVQFLLSSNIGEVVAIFLASLISAFTAFNLGVPLLPIHLLWINLITDSLPAFALGMEPVAEDVMDEKPRPKSESFFANGLGITIAWQGIMIGLLTLAAYMVGNSTNHELGMTMAFVTLALTQLIHAFNMKSSKSILNRTLFNNKYLWYALFVGIGLQLVIIYVPMFQEAFKLVALDLSHLSIAVGFAFVPLIVVEIIKFIKNR